MPLVQHDLVPQFLEFWAAAADRPRADQLRLWNEYTATNVLVLDDVTRFGAAAFDAQPVLDAYPGLVERIRDNAERVGPWLQDAADDVTSLVGEADLPLRCVTLVGLNRSFGWVSVHEGQPWLFIPVELIADEVEAGIVMRHEMAHLAQIGMGGSAWLHDERLGLLLYSEGYAPLLTAEIWPDVPLSQHISIFGGQDEWYAQAIDAVPEATKRLAATLESDDPATLNQYFAVGAPSDLPERIGYVVGVQVVQRLREQYSWRELARFTTDRALDETRRALAALTG